MTYNRTGTVFLQVRRHPNWTSELRVVRATQKYPEVVAPGCILIKLKLQIPNAAFAPIEPVATVVVPEELVQHPIEVEAVEP